MTGAEMSLSQPIENICLALKFMNSPSLNNSNIYRFEKYIVSHLAFTTTEINNKQAKQKQSSLLW